MEIRIGDIVSPTIRWLEDVKGIVVGDLKDGRHQIRWNTGEGGFVLPHMLNIESHYDGEIDDWISNNGVNADTKECGGQFTPIDYTRLRGKAFVFSASLENDKRMDELHAQHLVEKVERKATAYRILEVWEDCPDQHYTLEEALEELAPYDVGVELKQDHGLLNIVGTAFYLQAMEAESDSVRNEYLARKRNVA
jgi:hypothetical protein